MNGRTRNVGEMRDWRCQRKPWVLLGWFIKVIMWHHQKKQKNKSAAAFLTSGSEKTEGEKKSTFSLVVTASKPRPLEVELLSRRLRGRSVISGDSSKWVAATSRQAAAAAAAVPGAAAAPARSSADPSTVRLSQLISIRPCSTPALYLPPPIFSCATLTPFNCPKTHAPGLCYLACNHTLCFSYVHFFWHCFWMLNKTP